MKLVLVERSPDPPCIVHRRADEERLERERKERVAKLKAQTQKAVACYERGLLVRYGLGQFSKLVAIAR